MAEPACDACLCMFDIDRTLTGKQGATWKCRGNKRLSIWDDGYGGGKATLSKLAAEGISTTFCNGCYLGITSAGAGSGEHSEWNQYILNNIMRGEVMDNFTQHYPGAKTWSFGTDVHSPFVLEQGNKIKQNSVELVRQWYGAAERGICIQPKNVYFFGDRTENIRPFAEANFNSREISCGSRDWELYGGTGMVGYCGAQPEEIQRVQGNILCK